MNKIRTALILAGLLTASPAAFSDFLGIYAGGGVWKSDFSGDIGDRKQPGADLRDLGLDDERNKYYFVALEHFIPVIPNIRLQQTDISLGSTAEISQSFVLDGKNYSATDIVTTDFDLSHLDATLYYELLDNWVNLDLGLTFRKFDGAVSFNNALTGQYASEKINKTVPMLYAKAQFDLPFTGFYIAASGNYTGYDGSDVSDFTAAVGYMSNGLILDLGFEVGVRDFSVKLDDVGGLDADMKMDGTYASFYLHF